MKLECNAKTLNAIADTLLERCPTAVESAAVIREAATRITQLEDALQEAREALNVTPDITERNS